MKGVSKIVRYYFTFSMVLLLLMCLSGCNGVSPTLPVINSFTVIPPIIDAGDSAFLSWEVINATSIIIVPGDMTFTSLSGSVTVFPDVATNYTLTATNAEGSVSSSVAINVTPIEPVEQIITIQSGPEGKDSYTSPLIADNGESVELLIGSGSSLGGYRTYLQFDLSVLPMDAVIVTGDLKLYYFDSYGVEGTIMPTGLYKLKNSWDEHTINITDDPVYGILPEDTISVMIGTSADWLTWDITDLLQGWVDGSINNNGMVIKTIYEDLDSNYIKCYSSDYIIDPSLRPKLEITYYLP